MKTKLTAEVTALLMRARRYLECSPLEGVMDVVDEIDEYLAKKTKGTSKGEDFVNEDYFDDPANEPQGYRTVFRERGEREREVVSFTRYCQRCGKELVDKYIVWLEMRNSTATYHPQGEVPTDDSQGLFSFGPDCAKRANNPVHEEED